MAGANFLHEEILCRWGSILEIVVADGGLENRGEVANLLRHYSVPLVLSAPFHPEADSVVERGHRPLVEAVIKLARSEPKSHENIFYLALWADGIATRHSTGCSPLEMLTGVVPVLPLDSEFKTLLYRDWAAPTTRTELI